MGLKFKPGDRVIFIENCSYSGYKYLDRGEVLFYRGHDTELVVKFDNGHTNEGQLDELFVYEEIYDTPLYKETIESN